MDADGCAVVTCGPAVSDPICPGADGEDGDPGFTPCEDHTDCAPTEACTSQGLCQPLPYCPDMFCQDEDPCTTDVCNPFILIAGGDPCVHELVVCDDGLGCTTDSCDGMGGCSFTPDDGACDDGNLCTIDSCNPDAGGCSQDAVDCDDGNPITIDSCDPATGECSSIIDPLHVDNDGDGICELDPCLGGGPAGDCDDDPSDGVGPAVFCTEPSGSEFVRIDFSSSVHPACPAGTELVLESDGSALNGPEMLETQVDESGDPEGFDNDCDGVTDEENTVEEIAQKSCYWESLGGELWDVRCPWMQGWCGSDGEVCDDGNACTDGDVCGGGTCAGDTIDCNDDDVCTTDSCDPTDGCAYSFNSNPCDDGSSCTENDACSEGACLGDTIDCDDGDVCTDDSCNALTGACESVEVDGAVVCDDGNPCTDDSCESDSGCIYSDNSEPCDDGSACTESDICNAGECGGDEVVCDDGNPCTDDSCDPETGECSSTPSADGTICEDGECSSGQCVCAPSCDGKACGEDGCGGTCGECGGDEVCGDSGQCLAADLHTDQDGDCFCIFSPCVELDEPTNPTCPEIVSGDCDDDPTGSEEWSLCQEDGGGAVFLVTLANTCTDGSSQIGVVDGSVLNNPNMHDYNGDGKDNNCNNQIDEGGFDPCTWTPIGGGVFRVTCSWFYQGDE